MPEFASFRVYCFRFFTYILLIAALCVAITPTALAAESGVKVRGVDLSVYDGRYRVSVDIHYRLSDKAREALNNGISLYWDIRLKLERQRSWLWNKALVKHHFRYRIQYQALINRYKVTNITTGDNESYATLAAALAGMSSIRQVDLLARETLNPEASYQVAVKVFFDREALPLPLRPLAYINSQWNLSSAWYLWPVER